MSTNGEKTQWIFPTIEDFPIEIRDAILMHFLMEYAKVNDIDFVKFITGVTAINKPETDEKAVERLLSLDQISIARIQKTLSIGFSKGARIIEGLEGAGLIARKNTNMFEWVKKDESVVREIVKRFYN
jgi:DNA segregation ATPase FtsK/SpoIIIE-like protein